MICRHNYCYVNPALKIIWALAEVNDIINVIKCAFKTYKCFQAKSCWLSSNLQVSVAR